MRLSRNKTAAITVSLFLMLSMVASIALQPTIAHTPAWDIPTYAYIHAVPNPLDLQMTIDSIISS